MKYVQFWRPGEIYKKISLAEPRLESWNAKSAPDQLKLQQYLDDIERNVGILPQSTDLFLHIDIDVKKREFLLHHHDLDNYLYPVVNRLRPYHFKYVSASKQVGSGSLLSIGQAKQLDDIADEQSWQHFY
ncbi:MAG TPA: hypothetical protein VJ761_17615, partial [Ktedonobacteraceae bacterium]|nr:hypothetical protein [Ktedonobacteraceae bacterium]